MDGHVRSDKQTWQLEQGDQVIIGDTVSIDFFQEPPLTASLRVPQYRLWGSMVCFEASVRCWTYQW